MANVVWQMWFDKHSLADVVRAVGGGGSVVGSVGGQYEFNEFNFTGLRVFGLMVLTTTTTPTSRVYC